MCVYPMWELVYISDTSYHYEFEFALKIYDKLCIHYHYVTCALTPYHDYFALKIVFMCVYMCHIVIYVRHLQPQET